MNVFVDTSAFLAVINSLDRSYSTAKKAWDDLLSGETSLFSSNYVILETIALLQRRFGLETVRLFTDEISPVIELLWVDENIHQQGLIAMQIANRRDLSLVDCTSFYFLRQAGLDAVFTLDVHFKEQGFTILPA